MSDLLGDFSRLYPTSGINNAAAGSDIKTTNAAAGKSSLDMLDFLKLMVLQFQNQDPENAASTSDMMNQLVQMSVVQAVTNITDAATMLYSSSLVGKEVTIGQFGENGLEELVGVVTGTGTYNGQQVVFVNDKTYYLSDIMAIGRLPEVEEPPEEDESGKPPESGDASESDKTPGE